MPPSLASLVHSPALGLTVLAGGDRLGEPVHWVHTSELEDPTPFLEGGELLLTTGMKLAADREPLRAYVHRLADAGVVGLGLGVGLTHARVPAPLVEAAAERGLPLLRVPQPTPFIAISKAVSAALAAERYEAVTRTHEAQQELTRAALGRDGTAALLRALARCLDGWAALYDAAGRVTHAAPVWSRRRAERLAGEVERLLGRPAPCGAAVQEDDCVELRSLGAGRRARGFLAVGTEQRLTTAERYLVHSAAALLTLSLERSGELRRAEARLGAALLRMLLAGEAGHARTVADGRCGGLLERDAAVRLVVAEPCPDGTGDDPPRDPLTALADRLEAASARAEEPFLAVHEAGRLTALAADGGAVLRACTDHAREGGGLAAGVSSALPAEAAATAREQAERALAVALRSGRPLVGHDEVGSGSLVPLLRDDAVRAFADGLLRPLREHDATSRGDLTASLRAWLSRHGQWDAAAADLGVHRHTLRHRMRRVEEVLGCSLEDPDTRMELWLALRAGRSTA
ncbi:PucR family transcriptional regulator [Streptomyces capparidis]